MRKRLTGATLLVSASIALAGCSDSANSDGLNLETTTPPSPSVSTSSPPESITVSAEEQAVLDAYEAFYAALAQAYADPPKAQDYLEPAATGAQFEQTNGAIKANFLAGEETVGSPVLNPVVESIEGTTAVVHDCQDTSGVQTQKIEGGQVIEVGRNPSSVQTTLQDVEGTWKVAATEYMEPAGVYC